jgi:hypothetical protein
MVIPWRGSTFNRWKLHNKFEDFHLGSIFKSFFCLQWKSGCKFPWKGTLWSVTEVPGRQFRIIPKVPASAPAPAPASCLTGACFGPWPLLLARSLTMPCRLVRAENWITAPSGGSFQRKFYLYCLFKSGKMYKNRTILSWISVGEQTYIPFI